MEWRLGSGGLRPRLNHVALSGLNADARWATPFVSMWPEIAYNAQASHGLCGDVLRRHSNDRLRGHLYKLRCLDQFDAIPYYLFANADGLDVAAGLPHPACKRFERRRHLRVECDLDATANKPYEGRSLCSPRLCGE